MNLMNSLWQKCIYDNLDLRTVHVDLWKLLIEWKTLNELMIIVDICVEIHWTKLASSMILYMDKVKIVIKRTHSDKVWQAIHLRLQMVNVYMNIKRKELKIEKQCYCQYIIFGVKNLLTCNLFENILLSLLDFCFLLLIFAVNMQSLLLWKKCKSISERIKYK